ncbi:MAG: hypothetical protein V1882_09225 [Candidatus Omnitrophota bacterium]
MTNPLDEGAIPSTSTTSIVNCLEETEVETYRYQGGELVLGGNNAPERWVSLWGLLGDWGHRVEFLKIENFL